MDKSTEKRKHTRVKAHIPVRYRKFQDNADTNEAGSSSKNLSRGGIRFKTAEFIPIACRLTLEIYIPMLPKPVSVISRIIWIRKIDAGDGYEAGGQFLEMSKKDRVLVSEYVTSLGLYNDLWYGISKRNSNH